MLSADNKNLHCAQTARHVNVPTAQILRSSCFLQTSSKEKKKQIAFIVVPFKLKNICAPLLFQFLMNDMFKHQQQKTTYALK